MANLPNALILAAALLLLAVSAALCVTSNNGVKRVAALFMVMVGAVLAIAALQAGASILLAGVTVAAAQILVGVGVITRLQEEYGTTDPARVDAADMSDEPAEPQA